MKNIGIVGCGIAGLHLGLFLQKHGIDAAIYSDKSPEQIRAGRIPNFVVRFENTLERERFLGVNHWDFEDFGVFGIHMYIGGAPSLIRWYGAKKRPASPVDIRLYQSTLLEDFQARGGRVVVGELQAGDVARLSERHDLMVVASGRGSLTEMFPRVAERSPYDAPQRNLTGAFYRGVDFTEPLGVIYSVSPGNGEIFKLPFTTFDRRLCSILIEAIPGQGLDVISNIRYADDPKKFEATVLELLREHAPTVYERIDLSEFAVHRPQDVIQGAITPTVRKGYVPLGNGKFALALGDVHITVDPIIAQGANNASKCAFILGEALLEDRSPDEDFCRETEQKLWEASRAACEWTNAMLQPPPPFAIEVFAAAAQNPAIADEIVQNFNAPERNWEIFSSPQNAANFLQKHNFQTVQV
ncbi:MAG TPA: styrene monooxygenase/indole monooxygenase family protein [Pyrinomonadaceae bacterium]|jgi:2-polyprenyl-6-methoxyphenol hydroxylase-like FAD-dependent oxidoreductase